MRPWGYHNYHPLEVHHQESHKHLDGYSPSSSIASSCQKMMLLGLPKLGFYSFARLKSLLPFLRIRFDMEKMTITYTRLTISFFVVCFICRKEVFYPGGSR